MLLTRVLAREFESRRGEILNLFFKNKKLLIMISPEVSVRKEHFTFGIPFRVLQGAGWKG